MRILCVAEKNSIGKAVSQILGGGQVRTENSQYKYVKNYKFTFDFPEFGNCHVVMTSVAGHLKEINFPESYGWGKCNAGRLFDAPIVETLNADQRKIADNIKKLSSGSDRLMIWTDCDREGEYIGKEIVDIANKGNPNITLDNTLRAQFSHLERRHILNAARNPQQLDKNAISAVSTRQELDLRTGAAFTRFLCEVFDKYRRQNILELVSYGSCQFPTLGFVVDRYKRVKNFVPEPFWYLEISVRKDDRTTKYSWRRHRFFDRMAAVILYEKCMRQDKAKVVSIKKAPTSKWRPLPLTTVELQKSCAIYFKMSAKDSLACAEKLYQNGFISYPRTETDIFPAKMNLKELIEKQTQSDRWGQYARSLIDEGADRFQAPRKGRHDDKAHPPIHPVIFTNGGNLNQNEKKVYEFVVRHFLAACSKDAKGSTSTVELQWGSELFSASGLIVEETNYLDVYTYQTWKSTTQIPVFELNEEVKLSATELKTGKTAPPSHMMEPELIALMDANGIGTDATIAEHIDKIKKRDYITETKAGNKKLLIPTTLGMALVDSFDKLSLKNSLTKPFLRKNLENELKGICDGRKLKEDVVHEMIDAYRESYVLSVQHRAVILDVYNVYRSQQGEAVL